MAWQGSEGSSLEEGKVREAGRERNAEKPMIVRTERRNELAFIIIHYPTPVFRRLRTRDTQHTPAFIWIAPDPLILKFALN